VVCINIYFVGHTVKQKKKRKKKGLPRVPNKWHSGEENIKRKTEGGFPECLGIWHSGKAIFKKKRRGLPRVRGHTRGRGFLKKTNFFPECCTQGRGFKKRKCLPRVLHSGKSKKIRDAADGVKSSPRVSMTLGKDFPECTRFGTRGRRLLCGLLPR
jgi:hypothetical protein